MSLKRKAENGNSSLSITEAEAELYDRQIRLWGLDAQKRYFKVANVVAFSELLYRDLAAILF